MKNKAIIFNCADDKIYKQIMKLGIEYIEFDGDIKIINNNKQNDDVLIARIPNNYSYEEMDTIFTTLQKVIKYQYILLMPNEIDITHCNIDELIKLRDTIESIITLKKLE